MDCSNTTNTLALLITGYMYDALLFYARAYDYMQHKDVSWKETLEDIADGRLPILG